MPRLTRIRELVTALIVDTPTTFLVEVVERKNDAFVVFLDDDKGLTLDTITKYTRSLRQIMEAEAPFIDGQFSLEVSSASLDRPLLFHRQYVKNIGRMVRVIPEEGGVVEGILQAVNEENIQINIVGSKKVPASSVYIAFSDIKKTFILVQY